MKKQGKKWWRINGLLEFAEGLTIRLKKLTNKKNNISYFIICSKLDILHIRKHLKILEYNLDKIEKIK